jgi:hypothetical protein
MTERPVIFTWDGQAMVPRDRRFAFQCDRQFVVGEHYTLVQHEDRSSASHRHYFAAIKEAWESLPESVGDRFASPEHLRKFALVKAGYRNERTHVAATKAEAQRLAAFVQPIDDFAIVTVSGLTVTVWTAKSQSVRAMGKADFYESKEAVLRVLAELIGVDAKALAERATEAA